MGCCFPSLLIYVNNHYYYPPVFFVIGQWSGSGVAFSDDACNVVSQLREGSSNTFSSYLNLSIRSKLLMETPVELPGDAPGTIWNVF